MLKQSRLKELYSYDKDTGNFTVLVRRGSRSGEVGSIGGYTSKDNGYRFIRIDTNLYREHRLVFLYLYGYMPVEVDHKDRNRSNNRIDNLRAVTRAENMTNKTVRENTVSGYIGITLHDSGKWRARIYHNGKSVSLGVFIHIEDAIKARKDAELKYGYLSSY